MHTGHNVDFLINVVSTKIIIGCLKKLFGGISRQRVFELIFVFCFLKKQKTKIMAALYFTATSGKILRIFLASKGNPLWPQDFLPK
jgi:hypothetical protein